MEIARGPPSLSASFFLGGIDRPTTLLKVPNWEWFCTMNFMNSEEMWKHSHQRPQPPSQWTQKKLDIYSTGTVLCSLRLTQHPHVGICRVTAKVTKRFTICTYFRVVSSCNAWKLWTQNTVSCWLWTYPFDIFEHLSEAWSCACCC